MLSVTEARKARVQGRFLNPSTKRSAVVKPTSNSPPRISQNQAIMCPPLALDGARDCRQSCFMARQTTIGNHIAPPKFIVFFALLFAGVGGGLEFLPRAQAIMLGYDFATAVFLLACIPLFRHKAATMRQAARH